MTRWRWYTRHMPLRRQPPRSKWTEPPSQDHGRGTSRYTRYSNHEHHRKGTKREYNEITQIYVDPLALKQHLQDNPRFLTDLEDAHPCRVRLDTRFPGCIVLRAPYITTLDTITELIHQTLQSNQKKLHTQNTSQFPSLVATQQNIQATPDHTSSQSWKELIQITHEESKPPEKWWGNLTLLPLDDPRNAE